MQHNSGADLGILLIEVLVKSENNNCTEWIPKLSKIFAKISSHTPERDTFLVNVVRWSSQDGTHGHPFLHQVLDKCCYDKEKFFYKNFVEYSTNILERKKLYTSEISFFTFKRWIGLCEIVN